MYVNSEKELLNILASEVGDDIPFSIERPEVEGRGDYSSNIALVRAKKEKRPPMAIAEELAIRLKEKYPTIFLAVEIAHPGFINMYLDPVYVYKALDTFLKPQKIKSKGKASVEFISANPTGPLHVGNARGGPIGDVIANVLSEIGYKVKREYFHNDAGAQVGKFADSLWHWYLKARRLPSTLPEGGYEGDYVIQVSRDACKKWKGALLDDPQGKEKLVSMALDRYWKENFATIKKLGISFDVITKESSFVKTKTKKVLLDLEMRGILKHKEGAVWYVPDDKFLKDRETVVIKSDGTYVYFANDIAYHKEKFSKNDLVVDILGEGHEGHIPKLRSVAKAFNYPQDHFHVVVHGQVNLLKQGKVVTMSKRKGNFVTAEEVLGEVGRDAFRFFMLQYSPHTGMQFDLSLAREHSKKNPVFYVQYAHARAASILKKSKTKPIIKKTNWSLLDTQAELNLTKHILTELSVIEKTASDFEVQRLTRFAIELAHLFTVFYETSPVLGSQKELQQARLGLVLLTKNTLLHILKLLGLSAPDKM